MYHCAVNGLQNFDQSAQWKYDRSHRKLKLDKFTGRTRQFTYYGYCMYLPLYVLTKGLKIPVYFQMAYYVF